VDISGEGNNGTIDGAASTHKGLKFDGTNDVVDLDNDIVLPVAGEWTFCYRADRNGVFGLTKAVVGRSTVNSYSRIIFTSSSQLYLESDFNGDIATTSDDYATTDGVDYVITCSNGILRAWKNGVELTFSDNALAYDLTIDRIGATASASYSEAEFEDMRFFNYAFSEQEAIEYHNSFQKLTKRGNFSDYPVGSII
jgi:hypothetical protein